MPRAAWRSPPPPRNRSLSVGSRSGATTARCSSTPRSTRRGRRTRRKPRRPNGDLKRAARLPSPTPPPAPSSTTPASWSPAETTSPITIPCVSEDSSGSSSTRASAAATERHRRNSRDGGIRDRRLRRLRRLVGQALPGSPPAAIPSARSPRRASGARPLRRLLSALRPDRRQLPRSTALLGGVLLAASLRCPEQHGGARHRRSRSSGSPACPRRQTSVGDPSLAPVWLPAQNPTGNGSSYGNHVPQWVKIAIVIDPGT